MKRFRSFLRLASVANFVLLVAGLVCYHGGVFNKLMTSSRLDEERPPQATAAAEPAMFASSKVGRITPPVTAPAAEQPLPMILGGSKSSIALLFKNQEPAGTELGPFRFTVDLGIDWSSAPSSPPSTPSNPTDPR